MSHTCTRSIQGFCDCHTVLLTCKAKCIRRHPGTCCESFSLHRGWSVSLLVSGFLHISTLNHSVRCPRAFIQVRTTAVCERFLGAWFLFLCNVRKRGWQGGLKKLNTVFKDCVKIILVDHLCATEGDPVSSLSGAVSFSFSPLSVPISQFHRLAHRWRHSSCFVDWLIIQRAVAGY